MICQKIIPLLFKDQRMMINTYCMRPNNHELYDPKGKCEQAPTKIDKQATTK